MNDSGISYQEFRPSGPLAIFVESFWMLSNDTATDKPVIILPDGRIDAFFSQDTPASFTLLGLETKASQTVLPAGLQMFAISFRPLAVDYFFKSAAPVLADSAYEIPFSILGQSLPEFETFESFYSALSTLLLARLQSPIDPRKETLFELIYASNGAITVKELSEKAGWSSRQINRFFQDLLGIPLKTYCNILRFRASLGHLKQGKLFPEQEFSDQSHFIREIKKYSGVPPKELARNKNDRFIQFYALPKK